LTSLSFTLCVCGRRGREAAGITRLSDSTLKGFEIDMHLVQAFLGHSVVNKDRTCVHAGSLFPGVV
jgi:hypothetical protein